MRFRKAKNKKKAILTMTENEMIEACMASIKEKGYSAGGVCRLLIPLVDKVDKLGRKRRRGIELQVELDE